ncbi:MAG: hypothetical protein V3U88_05085, partial [Methylococcales bacterium]
MSTSESISPALNQNKLAADIKSWGQEFGFQQIGFADAQLDQADKRLQAWLKAGFHGEMSYMQRHGSKRS